MLIFHHSSRVYVICALAYMGLEILEHGNDLDPTGFTEFDVDLACSHTYTLVDVIFFAILGQ